MKRKIDKNELDEILKSHKLWLDTRYSNQVQGARADLSKTDLSEMNLSSANLRSADLRSANLRSADLETANLRSANLRSANLESANLSETKVFTFSLGKHFAFYHEGYLKIGCHGLKIEEWKENYREIGSEENYSEDEINLYGQMINFIIDNIHG